LANLESPLGGREEGRALWKGVIVREAIRSAWRSVEEGLEGGLTDWRTPTAMGLDVIGEDQEEEEEEGEVIVEKEKAKEERWFEDLLTTLDDEEADTGVQGHEWVESCVSMVEFDEVEYDEEGMMAFTLPSVSPASSASSLELSEVEERVDVEVVEVVEVDDTWECDCDDDSECPSHTAIYPKLDKYQTFPLYNHASSSSNLSPSAFTSPSSTTCDLDEDNDHNTLIPPPLLRSYSSNSSSCEDNEQCLTPPAFDCEELEVDLSCGAGNALREGYAMGLGLTLQEEDEFSFG